MVATTHPASPRQNPRRPATTFAHGADDSPHAPAIRRWLGHQASRHRDLLLNLQAASRLASR